jgi:hypothetical protein
MPNDQVLKTYLLVYTECRRLSNKRGVTYLIGLRDIFQQLG